MEVIEKPWGYYENLQVGDKWLVKKLVIKPYQKLSYQYHGYRDEYWVVVSGNGEININHQEKHIWKGDMFRINKAQCHRVKNIMKDDDLIIIEVQIGDKIDEDDIIRIFDEYGRVDK